MIQKVRLFLGLIVPRPLSSSGSALEEQLIPLFSATAMALLSCLSGDFQAARRDTVSKASCST